MSKSLYHIAKQLETEKRSKRLLLLKYADDLISSGAGLRGINCSVKQIKVEWISWHVGVLPVCFRRCLCVLMSGTFVVWHMDAGVSSDCNTRLLVLFTW